MLRQRVPAWLLVPSCLAMAWTSPFPAHAQTGVSDDRVALPDGPGSLSGLGDNVSADGNMGLMTTQVPIDVPLGFPDMSPGLALTYNSGGGASVVGMGWTFGLPSIERMSSRGVPTFGVDDLFAADGGTELVRLPGTDPPVYRARFEGSFVKWTWMERGTGAEGYFLAEYPDGRKGYFGADSTGALVQSARVSGTQGTFRYHLVDVVDVDGHRLRHTYVRLGSMSLPNDITWVFDAAGSALQRVVFDYEPRNDASGVPGDSVSDCRPGFNMLLQHRMSAITVTTGGQVLHRYALTYEPYATSGGFTRLLKVEEFAGDGTPQPRLHRFGYSRALGGVCTDANCGVPRLNSMGTLPGGVDFQGGNATLIDINGDGLPDVVHTPTTGAHQFFKSNLHADGTHAFDAPTTSALGNSASQVASASVKVLDFNGDGFADLVDLKNNQAFLNTGTGDWSSVVPVGTGAGGLDALFVADAADGKASIQFLDFDNDKKIDIIQATTANTLIYRNGGAEGYAVAAGVDVLGKGFQEDNLQLADMNGDNLLDAVAVYPGGLSYRLNLGRGKWAPWVDVTGLPINAGDELFVELQDLNGDSLSDLVVVLGNQVKFAINSNGSSFLPPQTITMAEGGSIPVRESSTTVLFADMNGNGSQDVVWISNQGQVTYLELFPVRPNLITRIENGLGGVSLITYASSVEHMARDGGSTAWTHRLPLSMIVVDKVDQFDLLNNIHEDSTFAYHDGYYDGVDKAFRGFERVETTSDADATQEAGRVVTTYDLGITDRYRAGLKLLQVSESDGRVISEEATTYADCPLADVPAPGVLLYDIRYVCLTGTTTTQKEGRPAAEWATTEEHLSHDGYGNVTLRAQLGVTAVGGGACGACAAGSDPAVFGAPCGPQCLGDERYTATTFVVPGSSTGGRWMLHHEATSSTYGRPGGAATETSTYYDDPPFVGGAPGMLTLGHPTRVTARRDSTSTDVVHVSRLRYNQDGAPVEALDANGSVGGADNHRVWTYDSNGLRVIRTEQFLVDGAGVPYSLRRDYRYDPLHGVPTEATGWMVVEGGTVRSSRNSTSFGYDSLGRLLSLVAPGGDTPDLPTTGFTYEMASPVSRVIKRARSVVGAAADLEEVSCFDGLGRIYQTRKRIADNRYLVSGFTVHNKAGQRVREHQPYESTNGTCDLSPSGALFEETRLDGVGRVVGTTRPDSSIFGTASTTRTAYLPLGLVHHDEEDTDAADAHANTPTTTRTDGLGRVIAVERLLEAGLPPVTHKVTYSELGELRSYVDPSGRGKVQEHDLLGRVSRVTDPDRGVTTFEHDAHGSVTRQTDARNVVTRFTYDGFNRVLAEWREDDEAGTRVSYTYDRTADCPAAKCTNTAGMLARVTYPVGNQQGEDLYGYQARGQGTYVGRRAGGHLFELSHTFDNAGRMTGTTYPRGLTVPVTMDGLGRVTSLDAWVPHVNYAPRGMISDLAFGNGVTTTFQNNALMYLDSAVTKDANQETLVSYGFTRNRLGHIVEVKDQRADDGRPMGNGRFTYDGFNRMVGADLDPDRPAFNEKLTLTYDNADNILGNTSSQGAASAAHVGEYTYDPVHPHAVTQAGGLAMEYDAAGNMSRRGADRYTWDHQNRLVSVARGAATVGSYAYGPTFQRVMKQEGSHTTYFLTPDHEIIDGVSTTWLRLGDQSVAKIESADAASLVLSDLAPAVLSAGRANPDPDETITSADAWMAEASRQGAFQLPAGVEASDTRALLAASARRLVIGTGAVSWMHHDHLGSTTAVTDETGAVIQRTQYYPFGLVRSEGDGGSSEDRRYTGKETDDSGLTYYGDRYSDAWLGRWSSPDPHFARMDANSLGMLTELVNPYLLVQNNPISGRDPDGAFFTIGPIGLAVGAVMGAALEMAAQKNRGEKFNWTRVAASALSGGLVGGVFGEVGLIGLGVSRGVEMASYHATDRYYQKQIGKTGWDGREITPAVAKQRAELFSVILGAVSGSVAGGVHDIVKYAGNAAVNLVGRAITHSLERGAILAIRGTFQGAAYLGRKLVGVVTGRSSAKPPPGGAPKPVKVVSRAVPG